MLDIDHFKTINDTCGHAAGDDVLREFAGRVRSALRGIDLACRLGGEEFVVVMPETTAARALLIGERIRERIAAEPFLAPEGRPPMCVTVSIGVGSLVPSDTPEKLLKRADEALYRAKREGRNRVAAAA
jgi:two-component system cell cycle response regulator